MKISIVIPTYNAEMYIRQALDSIVKQDYKNWEIFAMDGGSKDSTLDILDRYAMKYKHQITWFAEKDNGEPDAINKGLKLVTGDIVAYLDADDIYLPNCFDYVSKYIWTNNVKWVYGGCKVIDEDGNETRKLVTWFKENFQPYYSYKTLLMFDYIAQPSVFWKREIIEQIGEMNINEKLAFDYDYWLRIGKQYKPGYIREYLSCWRSHKSSETAKALSEDMKDGLKLAVRYSPKEYWLRPFQYGVYGLSLLGYKAMGSL